MLLTFKQKRAEPKAFQKAKGSAPFCAKGDGREKHGWDGKKKRFYMNMTESVALLGAIGSHLFWRTSGGTLLKQSR